MKIICISGKAQHGKDTTAAMMKRLLEEQGYKVLVAHYGDLVKYICKTFFDWNGEKDVAGRTLLQYVGTDMVREKYPNYWVDFLANLFEVFESWWDYVLIPDTRFPNEVSVMKERFDTTHVRVERRGFSSGLTSAQLEHPSEVALDDYTPDCYIMNCGDLDFLWESVNTYIKEISHAE